MDHPLIIHVQFDEFNQAQSFCEKNKLFTFHCGPKINLLTCIGGHLEFPNHTKTEYIWLRYIQEAFQPSVVFNDSVLSEKNDL